MHRPFGPQIRDSKRERRPAPSSLPRRAWGNVKAKADNIGREGLGYVRKVMPRAGPGVENAPQLRLLLLNVLRDSRRDGIEVSGIEECCPMPQLFQAVTSRRRLAWLSTQEIDVALAGQIEAVAIPAGECASRSSQIKPTNRASQQPVTGTG